MQSLMKVAVFISILLMLVIIVPFAQAQSGDVFVSPDEDWQIEVPNGYEIDIDRENVGVMTGDQVEITLYSPLVLEDLGYTRIRTGKALLEAFAADEKFEFVELDSAESVDGMYVGLFSSRRESLIAIAKTFSDDSFGLALIALDADAPDDVIVDAINIVSTFDVGDGSGSSTTSSGGNKDPKGDTQNTSSDLPESLNDFDGDWEDAVAELEDDQVIGKGGTLVYFEDYAFIAGQGANYTSLARKASVQDLVVAGELTFEPDGKEYQTCSLAARVKTESNGSTNIFTEFGVNTENQLYIYDSFGTGENDTAYYNLTDIDPEDVHHYLVLMIDNQAALYMDGELIAAGVEVDPRTGSFGVLLRGDGSKSRCEVRNTWAYSVPRLSDVCEATSTGDINKRSGPGTSFSKDGTLKGGKPKEVIAYADGDDNFTWYQLQDESWVREDLITLNGPCDDLPEGN